MNTLKDYVKFIADGMGVYLNDDQLIWLTEWLINNEDYKEVLHQLEEMIQQVRK